MCILGKSRFHKCGPACLLCGLSLHGVTVQNAICAHLMAQLAFKITSTWCELGFGDNTCSSRLYGLDEQHGDSPFVDRKLAWIFSHCRICFFLFLFFQLAKWSSSCWGILNNFHVASEPSWRIPFALFQMNLFHTEEPILLYPGAACFLYPTTFDSFEAAILETTASTLIIKHLETNFVWNFDAVKTSFCTKKQVSCRSRLLKFTCFPCAEGSDQKLALISLHWQYQVLTVLALISNGNVAFLRAMICLLSCQICVAWHFPFSNHFQSSLTCFADELIWSVLCNNLKAQSSIFTEGTFLTITLVTCHTAADCH